jgi:hypothetical protein
VLSRHHFVRPDAPLSFTPRCRRFQSKRGEKDPAFLPGQRTPGLGVWSRTDGHTFSAVSDAFILFPSVSTPPGFKRGVQRITQTIEVNGDDLAAKASTQFFDTDGVQYDAGCATAVAHRFERVGRDNHDEDKDKD